MSSFLLPYKTGVVKEDRKLFSPLVTLPWWVVCGTFPLRTRSVSHRFPPLPGLATICIPWTIFTSPGSGFLPSLRHLDWWIKLESGCLLVTAALLNSPDVVLVDDCLDWLMGLPLLTLDHFRLTDCKWWPACSSRSKRVSVLSHSYWIQMMLSWFFKWSLPLSHSWTATDARSLEHSYSIIM